MAVEKILLQFDADIKALKADLDKTKKQLGDVETKGKKTTSSLTSSFKSVGAAIGVAFSVQVLIQFTKKAVELYDIQAKAEASLLQALKGKEDVQKRLIAQASELQKVTLFGDEETIKAQAMLAKFGMTETQIRRLIPLIQDYAAAQGQDLVSAADMVARSVGSSTNALSRYGIEINGAVGSNERLESAVESLSEMFGGQAVAAAEAGAGAVTQFQNTWGDFAESVGAWILPALTRVTGALGNFVEAMMVSGKAAAEMRLQVQRAFEDKQYILEQDLFIDYLNEEKSRYNDLDEAARQYLKIVNDIVAQYNERQANGEILNRVEAETYKSYVRQIDAISDYVDAAKTASITVDDLNKKVLDLSESLDKLPKILSDIYDPLSELPDETERWRAALSRLLGDVENNDGLADFYKGIEDAIEDADDANVKFFENLLKNQDLAKKNAENYRDAQFDIAKSLFSGMSDLNDQQTQRYIDNLQRQLDAGRITQGQFENERASALRKQAKQDKAYSIFKIILDTAQSIMRLLAQGNIPGSVAAGITGALQLGTATNAPLPAFAKGVVDLKGEGTETSDSIFARLSKGESVVTAKGTRQDKGLFEAANKLMLEDYINANYVLPALKEKQKSEGAMFDDYRLYLSLQNMKSNDSKNTNRIVEAIIRQKDNRRRYWA